jgi:Mycothiol maleylpyruvate isomerase N-terminal domain
MSEWGVSVYGEPCRACGFSWKVTTGDAIVIIAEVPSTYARTLVGAAGSERHPDLSWSVAGYVSHVADNLRIWAERLAGIAAGAPPEVASYDQDELARVRDYDRIPLEAALWSLSRSVAGWQYAVRQTQRVGVVLIHPEQGQQLLADVVLTNAHDAFHHHWDIERSLGAEPEDGPEEE